MPGELGLAEFPVALELRFVEYWSMVDWCGKRVQAILRSSGTSARQYRFEINDGAREIIVAGVFDRFSPSSVTGGCQLRRGGITPWSNGFNAAVEDRGGRESSRRWLVRRPERVMSNQFPLENRCSSVWSLRRGPRLRLNLLSYPRSRSCGAFDEAIQPDVVKWPHPSE
jgi:hypothetical protein